ncbi:MAG: FAD/NAD(P)-binding protein [Desulfovibrio sp.]|nr:FAD/NAD(P)-binding protein [Desulfovibrio sp.]
MPHGITPRPLLPHANAYAPMLATVHEIIEESPTIKSIRVVLNDDEAQRSFTFEPGQVGQLSVFGAGEATFVISSPPSEKRFLQFSVMLAGEVTAAIHRLSVGETVGVRAPLGNFFPYKDWFGKNVFFIAGGIGIAPIRTIMLHVLEHAENYGSLHLLFGARKPGDLAFKQDIPDWLTRSDLDCTLCVDRADESWSHKTGMVPSVLEELAPQPENTVAVLCGPPVMIKYTIETLEKLGFSPEHIITTLEKRMKCGIGICGRCNIGGLYVCVDGPVFSWKTLQGLPNEL